MIKSSEKDKKNCQFFSFPPDLQKYKCTPVSVKFNMIIFVIFNNMCNVYYKYLFFNNMCMYVL